MSNDLSDKDKDKEAPALATGAASFGAYAAPAQSPVQSFDKQWENAVLRDESGQPWKASRANRLAIRTFSRGVLGAMAFAGMGWYARGGKEIWKGMGEYDHTGKMEFKKPLTVIAKIVDTLAGKPIKSTIHAITGDAATAERAVRFRASAKEFSGVKGRTLGAEVVGVTADFAAMSIGDAFGRDFIDAFDPNLKKPWRDDDGTFSASKTLKSMARTGWRYVSYNAGEDWAVALPYVYFMRGLKHTIGNLSPGFRYDSDRGLNGGTLKIDANSNVIGNYNKPGIVDLQARFTAYNMGTLLYREWYDWAADKWWNKKPTRLYGDPFAPVEEKDKGLLGAAAYLAKWVTRGIIKGGIYMTPSVPFFWITRTPQSKYKGLFVDPKTKEILGYIDPNDKDRPQALHANEISARYDKNSGKKYFTPETPVFRNRYSRVIHDWDRAPGTVPARNPHVNPDFDAYAKSFGMVDAALNGIGSASDAMRKKFHHLPSKVGYHFEDPNTFWEYKRNADRYWNAAISYTPYFMAKTELASIWDTGKTDLAAERLIEGAAKLNWGEFKAGAGELWASLKGEPLADPAREREAQRRILVDRSSADEAIDKTSAQRSAEEGIPFGGKRRRRRGGDMSWQSSLTPQSPAATPPAEGRHNELPWHQRVVSGPKSETLAGTVGGKPISHSDREQMRKLLEEVEPPTNSRH